MYPLKKGKTTNQAHVGLPEGTFEEEHGRKGFYDKSAHLYHAHPPTGWIRFEGKLKVKVKVTVGFVSTEDGDVARLIVVRPQKK